MSKHYYHRYLGLQNMLVHLTWADCCPDGEKLLRPSIDRAELLDDAQIFMETLKGTSIVAHASSTHWMRLDNKMQTIYKHMQKLGMAE